MADTKPAETADQETPGISDVKAPAARSLVADAAISDLADLRRAETAGENRQSVHESIAKRVDELRARGTHHMLELADLAMQRWHVQPSVAIAAMQDLGTDHLNLDDADQLIPAYANKEAK